ncbi:restriction endonuclease [Streptomyces sp. NPDC053427]|uniref:restriction endonuclease n=1 Tax=Streptomyces sp. NPDC053427 TaxID=3365701 RepID=UPI0037D3F48B
MPRRRGRGRAGDLGADVVALAPEGRRVVLQCKRYGPAIKVHSQDVQRFGGTCFESRGPGGGRRDHRRVHRAAAEYAEQCGIRCVAPGLIAWTDGVGPAPWEEAEGAHEPEGMELPGPRGRARGRRSLPRLLWLWLGRWTRCRLLVLVGSDTGHFPSNSGGWRCRGSAVSSAAACADTDHHAH